MVELINTWPLVFMRVEAMILMRKLILQIILRASIVLVFLVVGLVFGGTNMEAESRKSMIAGMVIGASLAGFSALYDYDVWSVKKKL